MKKISSDIDIKVSEILEEWEYSIVNELDKIITRSLHYNVIPDIYHFIRSRKSNNTAVVKNKKIILNRFLNYKRALLHLFHIIAWSLKWILFFKIVKQRKKILLCSLNTERKLSRIYLDNLIRYANEQQAVVAQFGTFTGFHAFFNPKVFSYPTFMVRLFPFFKKSNSFLKSAKVIEKLENICESKLGFGKPDLSTNNKYFMLYKGLFFLYTNFLSRLSNKNKITFLIQDGGYTSTKILYTYGASLNNIKTIMLDHSIVIYKHLFKNVLSDYYYCWGEFSKQRMNDFSGKKTNISIISRPDIQWESRINKSDKNIILYCMQATRGPILQTINRSLEYSLTTIYKLDKFIRENFSEYKLLLKPHPEDDIEFFQSLGIELYLENIQEILPSVKIFLTEDSTITLELLKYDIPLLYILDKSNSDTFSFVKFKLENLITDVNDIENKLKNIPISNINQISKKKMFEYYFGTDAGNKYNLYEKLNKEFSE